MKKQVIMTQALIDRYGKINGDNDTIHYDKDLATARGFRGTLAHGLHIMGYAAGLAAEQYGELWYTQGEIYTKWIAPVCPGDELTVELCEDGSVEGAIKGHGVNMVGYAKTRKA